MNRWEMACQIESILALIRITIALKMAMWLNCWSGLSYFVLGVLDAKALKLGKSTFRWQQCHRSPSSIIWSGFIFILNISGTTLTVFILLNFSHNHECCRYVCIVNFIGGPFLGVYLHDSHWQHETESVRTPFLKSMRHSSIYRRSNHSVAQVVIRHIIYKLHWYGKASAIHNQAF